MTLENEPQLLQLANMGLFTMPNALSKVPQGSLLTGSNVVVDFDGLLSNRRGMKNVGTVLLDPDTGNPQNIYQYFEYKGVKIIWTGDNLSPADATDSNNHLWWYDSDGNETWTFIQKGVPPSAMSLATIATDRYHSSEGNSNIFYTSTAGILKQDDPKTSLYSAGGFPGLDGVGATTGSSGFMTNNTEVAYRIVWTYTDANDNVISGTPSTRVVVSNASGGTRNVALTFTIPRGATVSDKYEIYRSVMSASSTTSPDDNLQLALTGNPASGDITAGYFSITDTVPEASLQAYLYTNAGQSTNPGENLPNAVPPLSRDMCFYKQYMLFGGGCQTQNTFLLSMLAAGSPNGIQNSDTVTITDGASSFVLTGNATEDIATGKFKVDTSGTPADNIVSTKESFIRVLNRYPANTICYAFDASTGDTTSLPGDFYLQEQNVGGSAFHLNSSRQTWSSPALPVSGATEVSKTGGKKNQLFCSKYRQNESVPLTNYMSVGNENYDILRILPLRDSTVVMKEDGLFRISGETFPFTITTLDTSVFLSASESPAVLNNQVYAYTNQGVVAISETGPSIISRPIENLLQQISSDQYPNFPIDTFGTSYQTDRKYILSTISGTNTWSQCSVCYVYNTITETWTTYTYPVLFWDLKEILDEKLYLGPASVPNVLNAYPQAFQERKSFNRRVDAADIEIPVTVIGSTSNIVEVNDSSKAVVGWSLAQLSLGSPSIPPQIIHISKITGILDSQHITVEDDIAWNTGSVFSAYEQPIKISVEYTPIHCGSANNEQNGPSIVKFFQEIQGYFQNIDFSSITFRFSSDFIASTTPTVLTPATFTTGWGAFPWGGEPWGGGSFIAQAVRTYVPLSARRAHWLNLGIELSQAMSSFTLAGFGLTYRPVSTRSK